MKREEQIEKARELLACGVLSKEACDAIKNDFPELSESEDERIRKFLLDYAIEMIAGLESDISLSTYDGIKGHDPDAEAELNQWQKAKAYLEKQEQKPWSEEDEKIMQTMIKEGDLKPSEIAWLKSLPLRCPKTMDNWKPSEK